VFIVLRRKRLKCPIVGRVLDSGPVLAERAPVNVVQTRTVHQFVGLVVDRDHVLVIDGIFMALAGDGEA
jgi:hypothetical protein